MGWHCDDPYRRSYHVHLITMLIILAISSILALTAVVWGANKFLPFSVCPICAGSLITWVWLVAAYFAGYEIDLTVPAILMGGSVVGVAYQLEKRFSDVLPATRLLWKVFFMPVGFVAMYAVLEGQWIVFVSSAAFLAAISARLIFPRRQAGLHEESIEALEKSMKDCC